MLDLPKLNIKKTTESIENFIKKYDKVVIGISGGIDSACVATLCARALGSENVLGILMPETKTPNQSLKDAYSVVKKLDIPHELKPIGPVVDIYKKILNAEGKTEIGNIKARLRMPVLYYYANRDGRIVAGTGNRLELLTGYFTKHGDGAVDILPIGNLYKTHVRELSKEIEVSRRIIDKPPSAELWEGQSDEGELGIKYEVLDKILYNLVDKGMDIDEIDYDRDIVKYVHGLIKKSEHKRNMPPKAKVNYYESLG